MKFIKKKRNDEGHCIEPENFILWKHQKQAELEVHYLNNDATKAWGCLHSSLPELENQEDGIVYYSKEDLAKELLKEQGFLCCYCNRTIHNEEKKRANTSENIDHNDRRWTIEHVTPKSENAERYTFDYCNLAASCSGGERVPQSIVKYCNNGRSDKPIAINPFMPECEEKIYFDLLGNILSDDEKIEETIGSGCLNLNYFAEERAIKIKFYYYANYDKLAEAKALDEDLPILIPKTTEQAINDVAKLSKPDTNGYFEEFCSAIISVLKRDIINLNQQPT